MGRTILTPSEANRILRTQHTYCRRSWNGEERVCTGGTEDHSAALLDLALLVHFGYFRTNPQRSKKANMEFRDHKFERGRERKRKRSPLQEYGRLAAALPPMPEAEREEILLKICEKVGLDPNSRRSYAGF